MPTHRWVIDSLGDRSAAVEVDGDHIVQIPLAILPAGVREGDVLSVTYDGDVPDIHTTASIAIDPDATRIARTESQAQIEAIRQAGAERSRD